MKIERDRSIHGAVYSNDLSNLTRCYWLRCTAKRNLEFFMYTRCYISSGKIATVICSTLKSEIWESSILRHFILATVNKDAVITP